MASEQRTIETVAHRQWVILIGGYGAFLFRGTEEEAEAERVHKARWERSRTTLPSSAGIIRASRTAGVTSATAESAMTESNRPSNPMCGIAP